MMVSTKCDVSIFVESNEHIAEMLKEVLQPGDLLLTQGAGNITTLAHQLREHWGEV